MVELPGTVYFLLWWTVSSHTVSLSESASFKLVPAWDERASTDTYMTTRLRTPRPTLVVGLDAAFEGVSGLHSQWLPSSSFLCRLLLHWAHLSSQPILSPLWDLSWEQPAGVSVCVYSVNSLRQWLYYILFYFILFYFILFYFITVSDFSTSVV